MVPEFTNTNGVIVSSTVPMKWTRKIAPARRMNIDVAMEGAYVRLPDAMANVTAKTAKRRKSVVS